MHLGWQAGEGGMNEGVPADLLHTEASCTETGLYTSFKTSPSPMTLVFNYSSFKITITM